MSTITIIKKPTPNFDTGRQGAKPFAVVIHVMQGFMVGTDTEFNTRASEDSSHYGVPRAEGPVHQYVDEADTAWHAGLPQVCYTNPALYPTWPLFIRGSRPNLYTIGIENEGFSVPCFGYQATGPWTDFQYEANAQLVAAAATRWKFPVDDLHVVRHGDIYVPKKLLCPGQFCDMARIVTRARQIARGA